MWHPLCFNKKIALLGTFCVPPTTDEDDKDPNHLLPRVTFQVSCAAVCLAVLHEYSTDASGPQQVKREDSSPRVTVFLFDDEASSWPLFWRMMVQNKSCDELRCQLIIDGCSDRLPSRSYRT